MPVNILMARTAVFLAGLWMSCCAAATHAQEMVTLSTRSGVTQSYFLTSAPKNSKPRLFCSRVPAA